MFVYIFLLFGLFMLICVPSGPTQYIFHTPMARYSLDVLKVLLNTNKQTNVKHSWSENHVYSAIAIVESLMFIVKPFHCQLYVHRATKDH